MNFVGHEIEDFKVNAYHDGETTEVSKKDVLGKWSIFFFYPADFSFVCPTELEALQDKYEDFKRIPNLSTRHGLRLLTRLARSNIQCLLTQLVS